MTPEEITALVNKAVAEALPALIQQGLHDIMTRVDALELRPTFNAEYVDIDLSALADDQRSAQATLAQLTDEEGGTIALISKRIEEQADAGSYPNAAWADNVLLKYFPHDRP